MKRKNPFRHIRKKCILTVLILLSISLHFSSDLVWSLLFTIAISILYRAPLRIAAKFAPIKLFSLFIWTLWWRVLRCPFIHYFVLLMLFLSFIKKVQYPRRKWNSVVQEIRCWIFSIAVLGFHYRGCGNFLQCCVPHVHQRTAMRSIGWTGEEQEEAKEGKFKKTKKRQ